MLMRKDRSYTIFDPAGEAGSGTAPSPAPATTGMSRLLLLLPDMLCKPGKLNFLQNIFKTFNHSVTPPEFELIESSQGLFRQLTILTADQNKQWVHRFCDVSPVPSFASLGFLFSCPVLLCSRPALEARRPAGRNCADSERRQRHFVCGLSVVLLSSSWLGWERLGDSRAGRPCPAPVPSSRYNNNADTASQIEGCRLLGLLGARGWSVVS